MSVAFETNTNSDSNRIQLPAMWIYNLSSESTRFSAANNNNNNWSNTLPAVKEEEYSGSSSSIGNNSDALSGGDDDSGEVQSKDNGVINGLNDLEKVLPIKRGISTFYAGKSKSYGSLADAVSVQSIEEIVKPEDAYSRKRKNMIAHHVLLDKHSESATGKRLARNSRDSSEGSSSMASRSLPPLPPNSRKTVSTNESSVASPRHYMRSPWRSLSLSDLQQASSFPGVSNNGTEVDGH